MVPYAHQVTQVFPLYVGPLLAVRGGGGLTTTHFLVLPKTGELLGRGSPYYTDIYGVCDPGRRVVFSAALVNDVGQVLQKIVSMPPCECRQGVHPPLLEAAVPAVGWVLAAEGGGNKTDGGFDSHCAT